MKHKTILIILLTLLIFNYCKESNEENNKKAVARVFDKYLYVDELNQVIYSGMSSNDSSIKSSNYIDMWIRKQLLTHKANLNLSEEQIDVDKKVEDYRTSLLIYKYKQKFIEQKLDTNISDADINTYYESHLANFPLGNNIVKALYIKILKSDPEIYKVRRLFRSNKHKDIEWLKEYSKLYATKFDYFNNDWTYFNDLLIELPTKIQNQVVYLKKNKYIQTEDSLYYYLINIKEHRLKRQASPLIFVRSNVKSILLNKRKLQLLTELENNIYQNALIHKNIEFYNEKK